MLMLMCAQLCLCTAGGSVTKHTLLICTGIKLIPAGLSATLDVAWA